MRDIDIFQLALGLGELWRVVRCDFDPKAGQLDLYLDFPKGSGFVCPICGREGCKAYDSLEKTWRHLNFFQYKAYIHARVPRIECPECGVKTVEVPWSRPDSGFTLLFEAFIMALAKEMPVQAMADLVGEHDTRLWRVIHHYVEEARGEEDFSSVRRVGVDETSRARGHNYVSIFADLDSSRVLFATPGKDSEVIEEFKEDLKEHKGQPDKVEEFCCDMSKAFISGIEKGFPESHITFDKFHVMKVINEAVDEVRRQEQKERSELKGTRYIWLKRLENLTEEQLEKLESLRGRNIKTARAYNLKLAFEEFWKEDPINAPHFLQRWYLWATHSRLKPIVEAAKTIRVHWHGIMRWFTSAASNGLLEGINSLVQAAKRRARGYRSVRNYIAVIYLIAGKLEFKFQT